jgi:predicted DNA repair protein MutK
LHAAKYLDAAARGCSIRAAEKKADEGLHVSVGLLGLLDDIAAIAKLAAASLDDVAAQAAKAGTKAAGVVIDDAAVTPRYVVGFEPKRELPIVWKIARGSLFNKVVILLPAALLLSSFVPWLITPLLMIGGAYLCYEGAEKLFHALVPHHAEAHEANLGSIAINPKSLEDEKVAGAIKTDFILSAEIMAITLAAIPEGSSIWMEAAVLAAVGIGITIGVYGVVALIVKADDTGVALARYQGFTALSGLVRGLGRALVVGMPYFLTALSAIGTAAMIWVGGGIVVHGLEHYGFNQLDHAIDAVAAAAGRALPAAGALVEWVVTAMLSGVVGLVVGALAIPLAAYVVAPLWRGVKRLVRRQKAA